MKRVFFGILAAVLLCALAIPSLAAAEDIITTDYGTHGDWVGRYGSDGYMLFIGHSSDFVFDMENYADTAPSYLEDITYLPYEGGLLWLHNYFEANPDYDTRYGLWTDETKTERFATKAHYYISNGCEVYIDTGGRPCYVTMYFIDYDHLNDDCPMYFTVFDEDYDIVDTEEINDYARGVYVTTKVQGIVTLDFSSSNNNSGAAAIFFDPIDKDFSDIPADEEPAAEVPADEEPAAEAPAAEEPAAETAASAADVISADYDTHGDWVGRYGRDGYMLFIGNSSDFVFDRANYADTMPSYVEDIGYQPYDGGPVWLHNYYEANPDIDTQYGLWTDESKTERFATKAHYYTTSGCKVPVDTGEQKCLVSIYFIDCDHLNDDCPMYFTVFDKDNNVIDTEVINNYAEGVYVTAEIQGAATLDFSSSNNPSGAAAIFFDPVDFDQVDFDQVDFDQVDGDSSGASAAEEPAAAVPAEPEAPADTTVDEELEAKAEAPKTFDAAVIALVSVMVSAAGCAISKKKAR